MLAAVWLSVSGATVNAAADPTVESLHEKWDVQRRSVHSGKVRFRVLEFAGSTLKQVSAASLREALTPDEARDGDALLHVIARLCGTDAERYVVPWATVELNFDGDKVREAITLDMRGDAEPKRIRGRDAAGEIYYRDLGSHQASLYSRRGAVNITSLRKLAFWPGRPRNSFWTVAGLSPQRIELRKTDERFERWATVDPESALVRHYYDEYRASQTPASEIWQGPPVAGIPPVILPAWRVEAEYGGGLVRSIWVSVIDAAELNTPVAPAELAVEIPPQTVVVDHRGERKQVFRTQTATPDVRAAADERRTARDAAQPRLDEPRPIQRWRFILACLSVVAVLAGVSTAIVRPWSSRARR